MVHLINSCLPVQERKNWVYLDTYGVVMVLALNRIDKQKIKSGETMKQPDRQKQSKKNKETSTIRTQMACMQRVTQHTWTLETTEEKEACVS